MSGGRNGGDEGKRVTSVKSDGRESTGNVASPEARSCFHRPYILLLDKLLGYKGVIHSNLAFLDKFGFLILLLESNKADIKTPQAKNTFATFSPS